MYIEDVKYDATGHTISNKLPLCFNMINFFNTSANVFFQYICQKGDRLIR